MNLKNIILLSAIFFSTSSYALTLKIASLAPDGSSWMNTMTTAAQNIAEQTQGRVKLKFYPGGIMGSDSSVIRKMRVGQLNGAALAISSLAKFSNLANLYGIAFTFDNVEETIKIREKYDAIIKADLKKQGYEILGISSGGFAYIMSVNPIHKVDDIRKQKFWLPDNDVLSQKTFANANVNPILLPVSDVYTNLQTGLINALAVNPTSAILLQWYSKINYIVDLPLLMVSGVFVLDSKSIKKLNKKDRAVVKQEIATAFRNMDAQNIIEEERAMAALKAGGVEFVKLQPKIIEEFKNYANANMDLFRDKFPKSVYKQMLLDLEQIRKIK